MKYQLIGLKAHCDLHYFKSNIPYLTKFVLFKTTIILNCLPGSYCQLLQFYVQSSRDMFMILKVLYKIQ